MRSWRPTSARLASAFSRAALRDIFLTSVSASVTLRRASRWGYRLKRWNTMPIWLRSSCRRRARLTTLSVYGKQRRSSNVRVPASGTSSRFIIRSNVLLPPPLGPKITTCSPLRTRTVMPLITSTCPNDLWTSFSSRRAPAVEGTSAATLEEKPPAVGDKRVSCDVAGLGRAQEENDRCDVVRLPDPSHRDPRELPRHALLRGQRRLRHLGRGRARSDRVDVDPMRRELGGHRYCHLPYRAFARVVRHLGVGRGDKGRRRREVDDLAPALGHHQPGRCLRAEENAFYVDAHLPVPVGLGVVEDRSRDRDAGVVDQDVDDTVDADCLIEQTGDIFWSRHVDGH